MKKFLLRKKWLIATGFFILVLIVFVLIFLPKSCSNKNDTLKEVQIEKQDTTKNVDSNIKVDETLLLKTTIDSLRQALSVCQGDKKTITKKPITKRKAIKKIAKPKILVATVVTVAPPKNEEVNLPFSGITIRKKEIISQKNKKIVISKAIINPIQQHVEYGNCLPCRTRYGRLGVSYGK